MAMIVGSSELANPSTHSALDLFEKPSLLINYENAYDQKVETQTGCSGPTLEFTIAADNKNCVDLNCIFMQVLVSLKQGDGTTKVNETDNKVVLVNNVLHSLFVNCEVYLNGVIISNSNNFYAHEAFIETEYSLGADCKNTWARCQGYTYESDPSDFAGACFIARQIKDQNPTSFYGTLLSLIIFLHYRPIETYISSSTPCHI